MGFNAADLSRLTPRAADLTRLVPLLCYCNRQLDRVGYWDQGRMVVPLNGVRRGGAPSLTGYVWRWRCRRCRATPRLAQGTLVGAYNRALAGRGQIALGVDV